MRRQESKQRGAEESTNNLEESIERADVEIIQEEPCEKAETAQEEPSLPAEKAAGEQAGSYAAQAEPEAEEKTETVNEGAETPVAVEEILTTEEKPTVTEEPATRGIGNRRSSRSGSEACGRRKVVSGRKNCNRREASSGRRTGTRRKACSQKKAQKDSCKARGREGTGKTEKEARAPQRRSRLRQHLLSAERTDVDWSKRSKGTIPCLHILSKRCIYRCNDSCQAQLIYLHPERKRNESDKSYASYRLI